MGTFITELGTAGTGVRLAVKDLIDVAGVPTTAGSRALAERAGPAAADAACLAGARAAGARIVGKANLHELAFGATGHNPWFGTPVNPLDPALVPGGSSSGSAVAVAGGDADVAYGTDTGGSVRIPPACCGTTGLKTTWGRIPTEGVWPLSPSFDTVGPMARDVAGLVLGMQLLEPGFAVADWGPARVGRVRIPALEAVDRAVDAALAEVGWEVEALELPEWDTEGWAASLILLAEAWASDHALVEESPELVGPGPTERLLAGRDVGADAVATSRRAVERWKATLDRVFDRVELLALPTMGVLPLAVDDPADDTVMVTGTVPVNVAGVPALALPVPMPGRLPASLQLVGPAGSEERLLAAGAAVEAAVGPGPFGG